jgi:GT2 family glycosyltransferase
MELFRLLEKLHKQTLPLTAVVVADNASEAELQKRIIKNQLSVFHFEIIVIPMLQNRGCGAGLKAAEEEALRLFPDLTHMWILDDDVVPELNCLEKLLGGLAQAKADMICPLLSDEKGKLWGFPEPRNDLLKISDRKIRPERLIRKCRTSQDVLKKMGPGPHWMWWCTGACVLVTRVAIDRVGLHREDYWMLGEDHEFSLRVGNTFRSVFICDVDVPHLPPVSGDEVDRGQIHYCKFLSLLQNLCYNGLWLSYSGPMWSYVPGNFKRFFQTFGFSIRTLRDALSVACYGGLCREPAGGKRGVRLREKVKSESRRAVRGR